MKKKITLIIADDHPLFRKGLIQIIESENNFDIIGETGDGEEALAFIRNKKPDIAILDVSMPKKTGLEILKEINNSGEQVRIIFLTMHKEEYFFHEAMDLGVKGYVLKENASRDISDCLRLVAEDNYAISPSISNYLTRRTRKEEKEMKSMTGLEELTMTEKKILKLISAHKSTNEIANELNISPKTAENHRSNISRKLKLHGSLNLLKFAIENKTIL